MLQGYIIVYDVTNESSFQCMDRLKKLIEKNKEKREVQYVAVIVMHAVIVIAMTVLLYDAVITALQMRRDRSSID